MAKKAGRRSRSSSGCSSSPRRCSGATASDRPGGGSLGKFKRACGSPRRCAASANWGMSTTRDVFRPGALGLGQSIAGLVNSVFTLFSLMNRNICTAIIADSWHTLHIFIDGIFF